MKRTIFKIFLFMSLFLIMSTSTLAQDSKVIQEQYLINTTLFQRYDEFSEYLGEVDGKEVNLNLNLTLFTGLEEESEAQGIGEIAIGDMEYPFIIEGKLKIDNSSQPQTFIFGPLDGQIQTTLGEEDFTLTLHYVPKTGQVIIPVNIGTLLGDTRKNESPEMLKLIFGKPFKEAKDFVNNYKNEKYMNDKENLSDDIAISSDISLNSTETIPYRNHNTVYKNGYKAVTVAAYSTEQIKGNGTGTLYSAVRGWAHTNDMVQWYNANYQGTVYGGRVLKADQRIEYGGQWYKTNSDPEYMHQIYYTLYIPYYIPIINYYGVANIQINVSSLFLDTYTWDDSTSKNAMQFLYSKNNGIPNIDLPAGADPRYADNTGIGAKWWGTYAGTDYGSYKQGWAGTNLQYEMIGDMWVDTFWTGMAWQYHSVQILAP